ncbi:hypothetical protein EV127DRAFT_495649 [Xylaria flabelliformis]|nr:hypothetical protein EV127DRAFT_495649 [Xylaria flabelliformis]
MPYQTRSKTRQKLAARAVAGPITFNSLPMPYQTRSKTRQKLAARAVASPITFNSLPMLYQARSKPRQKLAARAVADPITFNSLPTEIRLMIWEEFVRIPRIIHIDLFNPGDEENRGLTCVFESHRQFGYTKSEQLCPLLGVNHESRYVALKGPLIHLELHIPTPQRKYFQAERIPRFFAIRSHDVLFFENSESWTRSQISVRQNARNVANVMIDLDVHSINYRNANATPEWSMLFEAGSNLTSLLSNRQSLKNFYCLTRSPAAKGKTGFGFDDLRELAPEHFPRYKTDLERWLEEFRSFPGNMWGWNSEFRRLKEIWRNVAM